ncbi:MAG: hypothetical protein V1820_02160, partial [archaeon]
MERDFSPDVSGDDFRANEGSEWAENFRRVGERNFRGGRSFFEVFSYARERISGAAESSAEDEVDIADFRIPTVGDGGPGGIWTHDHLVASPAAFVRAAEIKARCSTM